MLAASQSHCSDPSLTDRLKQGMDHILSVAKEIAEVEISFGLQASVEDYQREFKFGLTEVVYQWAKGEEFINVIQLTDVSEVQVCSEIG
uniref:ATP-dependent RNA helicase Ski2/MTR4 C-terminal domain-containing protein n=1 Tax=Amphimedon queenslandica TaxID=400682 RepID=A0A1X7UQJ2_AMPQE